MRGLLADMNAEAHVDAIVSVLRSPAWLAFWEELRLTTYRFRDFGLDRDAPDSDVWHFCQARELLLVTGNRNGDRHDSLDTTIVRHGSLSSLPVITIASMDRLLTDKVYRHRAAERLIDFLVDVDSARGSGRLFIP